MTQEKTKDTLNQIVEQGKQIVEKGNQRHVIVRDEDGNKVADLSLTVVAVVAVILFFAQPFGLLIAMAVALYGIIKKMKVEVLREVTDDEDVVEVQLPKDKN